MKIVAIIPALNEEGAIEAVVRAIPPTVNRIVVVDNGSTDATASVASRAGADVISQSERGYGAACMTGADAAGDADVYVFLDGDGSDPPERIADLVQIMVTHSLDLVLGVRKGDVEPGSMYWHQRIGNLFMSWLISRLTGVRLIDLPSLKVIRGDLLRSLEPRERQHGWTAELITKCACRGVLFEEVPTGYRCRIGKSKVSGSIKGSVLAAFRLNAAIIRIWLTERHRDRQTRHSEAIKRC